MKPTITVAGSTSGESVYRAGAEIWLNPSMPQNEHESMIRWIIIPKGEVSTSGGAGTIFSLGGSQESTGAVVSLGAAWTRSYSVDDLLGGRPSDRAIKQAFAVDTMIEAGRTCRKLCRNEAYKDDESCKAFRDAIAELKDPATGEINEKAYEGVDPAHFCSMIDVPPAKPPGGAEKRLARARYSRSYVAFGANGGATHVEYFDVTPDAVTLPDGTVVDQLTDTSKVFGKIAGGLSGNRLWLNGAYIEGIARYDYGPTVGTTNATFCVGRGVVVDPPIEDGSFPAETCTERVYEKPPRTHQLSGRFFPGWAELDQGWVRISAGGGANVNIDDGKALVWSAAIEAPVTFNFLAARRQEGKLAFEGLLRLTPFARISRERGEESEWTFGVAVSLLLKGNMFSYSWDEL